MGKMCMFMETTETYFVKENNVDFSCEVSSAWQQLPGEQIQGHCEEQYLILNKCFSDTSILPDLQFMIYAWEGKDYHLLSES